MKPEEAPNLDGYLRASDVAEELNVTRQTVNTMIHAGEFKTLVKVGKYKKPMFMVKESEVLGMKESRSFPRSLKEDVDN